MDRAFFYVRANKVGTVADQNDALCVEGNRKPVWTSAANVDAIKGAWLDKLLRACKLSLSVCEDYLYCYRDEVTTRSGDSCPTRG